MTIQFEEVEYCKMKVKYVAEPDIIEEKKKVAVNQIKRSGVKIPGFRMGKATDLAIRVNMADTIEKMVVQELVSEAYDEALFETQAKPVGRPDVLSHRLDGRHFECEMMISKKPVIELKEYTGFIIPEPHVEESISDKAENTLQKLRVSHGDVHVYGEDDFVQEGDQVTLSTVVKVEGEEISEMNQEGVLYEVGQAVQLIPEFDSGLYGMKPGESKEFFINVAEGDDRYVKDVQGKQVQFNVTVHMGTKKVPAALDDILAKKLGFETYEELHRQIMGAASAQFEHQKKRKIQDQIMARILENHDFEVPDWMVRQSAQMDAQSKGIDWNKLSDDEIDTMLDNHERDVRLSLILDEIREENPEASYSDQELIEKLRGQISSQGRDPNALISNAAQSGYLMGILAALKDELTMDWLQKQNTIASEADEDLQEKVEKENE